MFYTLVFHVLGIVVVKSRGRFGVLKYNIFCLLTHIIQPYFPKNGLMLTFLLDSNAYTLTTESFSVYFHFSEIRIFMTPSP